MTSSTLVNLLGIFALIGILLIWVGTLMFFLGKGRQKKLGARIALAGFGLFTPMLIATALGV